MDKESQWQHVLGTTCQVHDLNDLASLDSGYGTAAPKQRAGRQGSRSRSRDFFNYVMGTWRSRWDFDGGSARQRHHGEAPCLLDAMAMAWR